MKISFSLESARALLPGDSKLNAEGVRTINVFSTSSVVSNVPVSDSLDLTITLKVYSPSANLPVVSIAANNCSNCPGSMISIGGGELILTALPLTS